MSWHSLQHLCNNLNNSQDKPHNSRSLEETEKSKPFTANLFYADFLNNENNLTKDILEFFKNIQMSLIMLFLTGDFSTICGKKFS